MCVGTADLFTAQERSRLDTLFDLYGLDACERALTYFGRSTFTGCIVGALNAAGHGVRGLAWTGSVVPGREAAICHAGDAVGRRLTVVETEAVYWAMEVWDRGRAYPIQRALALRVRDAKERAAREAEALVVPDPVPTPPMSYQITPPPPQIVPVGDANPYVAVAKRTRRKALVG